MKYYKQVLGASMVVALAFVAGVHIPASAQSMTVTAAPVFVRDLTVGATGSDVLALQKFLNSKGFVIAATGAGSPGLESTYFGSLTRSALARYQAANGIVPAAGYFGPLTRGNVNANYQTPATPTTPSTGVLKGGAGDLADVKKVTSGTETEVAEGREEKVLAMELEADDNSDLAITSIRVKATVGNDGSTRLNRYADEIIVYMGSKEVGSMDVSDFSRSGAVHTGTITLKDAIIRQGDKARFYVAFVANDVIDSNDQDNTVALSVDRIRYEDASGAILTDSQSDITATVSFEDATQNDGAKVQSSSSSPDSTLLKVEDNSNSDEYHVFTFKINADSDSSDVVITNIDIDALFENAGASRKASEIVSDIYLKVGSEKYDDYTIVSDGTFTGSASRVFSFDIDEGDLEITGGDTEDVKVYVKFGKQDGKYNSGTTMKLSVAGANIDAENANGDNIDIDGTVTGKEHTLSLSAATVSNYNWVGSSVGSYIDFYFTVEADDEDFDVLASSIASTTLGSATVSGGTLTRNSGDATSLGGGDYRVSSGDTATFRIRYEVSGANGTYAEARITSVAGQEVPDSKQVSPTVVRNINN